MKHAAKSARLLRATVGADGLVYHVDGPRGTRSVASGRRPADFAGALAGRDVRIPACRRNAALICVAHARAASVQLGRPPDIAWDWDAGAASPGEALAHVRDSPSCPSIGGWHAMTPAEVPAYAMAALLDGPCRDDDADAFTTLLAAHPAWPALSFVPHLAPAWACCLLASVLDPRWWVSPDRPDRPSPLKAAFGLVSVGPPSGRARRVRRKIVLDAWKTTEDVPPNVNEPGYFLWRCWASADGGVAAADLRASRKFLSYVRATWLDALLGDSWCPDRLFVPEHFFGEREGATAVAWRGHMAAIAATA